MCGQRSFRRARPPEMAPRRRALPDRGDARGARPARSASPLAWSREAGRRVLRAASKRAGFREASRLAARRLPRARAPRASRRARRPCAGGSSTAWSSVCRPAGRRATWPVLRGRCRERNALLAAACAKGAAGRARRARGLDGGVRRSPAPRCGATGGRRSRNGRRFFEPPLPRRPGRNTPAIARDVFGGGRVGRRPARRPARGSLPVERRRGHSLAGPHRDDLLWTRDGEPLAAHGVRRASSPARWRSSKLAEWRAVAKAAGGAAAVRARTISTRGFRQAGSRRFFDALPARPDRSADDRRRSRRGGGVWPAARSSKCAPGAWRGRRRAPSMPERRETNESL